MRAFTEASFSDSNNNSMLNQRFHLVYWVSSLWVHVETSPESDLSFSRGEPWTAQSTEYHWVWIVVTPLNWSVLRLCNKLKLHWYANIEQQYCRRKASICPTNREKKNSTLHQLQHSLWEVGSNNWSSPAGPTINKFSSLWAKMETLLKVSSVTGHTY